MITLIKYFYGRYIKYNEDVNDNISESKPPVNIVTKSSIEGFIYDISCGIGMMHCYIDGKLERDVYFDVASVNGKIVQGDIVMCSVKRDSPHLAWWATDLCKKSEMWDMMCTTPNVECSVTDSIKIDLIKCKEVIQESFIRENKSAVQYVEKNVIDECHRRLKGTIQSIYDGELLLIEEEKPFKIKNSSFINHVMPGKNKTSIFAIQ